MAGTPAGEKEPEPLGFFKSPYVEAKGYRAHVRFHAAWPVGSTDQSARVIAYGASEVPAIIMRPVGKGKIVLVGDTSFVMNKNLEREGGEAFEGMRENADFWRWFIPYLTGGPAWYPSAPSTQPG